MSFLKASQDSQNENLNFGKKCRSKTTKSVRDLTATETDPTDKKRQLEMESKRERQARDTTTNISRTARACKMAKPNVQSKSFGACCRVEQKHYAAV